MKKFEPSVIKQLYKKFLFSLSCTYSENNKQIKILQPSYPELNF